MGRNKTRSKSSVLDLGLIRRFPDSGLPILSGSSGVKASGTDHGLATKKYLVDDNSNIKKFYSCRQANDSFF